MAPATSKRDVDQASQPAERDHIGIRMSDFEWRVITFSLPKGVRDRVMTAVSEAYNGHVQMIDSTSVRVNQHAANEKGHTRIAYGPLARRADDQDPRPDRRLRAAARTDPDARPGRRLPGSGSSARPSARGPIVLADKLAAPPTRSRRCRARRRW